MMADIIQFPNKKPLTSVEEYSVLQFHKCENEKNKKWGLYIEGFISSEDVEKFIQQLDDHFCEPE